MYQVVMAYLSPQGLYARSCGQAASAAAYLVRNRGVAEEDHQASENVNNIHTMSLASYCNVIIYCFLCFFIRVCD